jgi:hypothetical protein
LGSTKCTPAEIEITPEMIDAGAIELAKFTRVFESLEDGAQRVFEAMMRAKNRASATCA